MLRYDPVIVLAGHRSGSTFLTRMLNASPNLVVWGEHGGFLVGARNSVRACSFRLADGGRRDGVDEVKQDSQTKFIPFMNSFSGNDYRNGMRDLLTQLFSKNLPEGTRWGFKELRYLSFNMVEWFFELWPDAKLIFNLRDPVDLCVSSIRAAWVVERLQQGWGNYTPDKIDLVVFNVLVRNFTLEKIAVAAQEKYGPDKVHHVWYEDAAQDPIVTMKGVFEFLEERNFDYGHIEKTAEHKVGRALKFNAEKQPSELDPENIARIAERLKDAAYELDFSKYKVEGKWDFCNGIMPGDQIAFDFRNI